MSAEEKKNSEIWDEIKNNNFSRIEEMTTITPEIVSILVKNDRDKIKHLGITSISGETAEELIKYIGILRLDHLTSISDSTARILAEHKGGNLGLNGLKSISPTAARFFVKHKTDISLCGLTSITNEVAKTLSEYEKINGCTGLSVELNIREIIEFHKKENVEILDKIERYSLGDMAPLKTLNKVEMEWRWRKAELLREAVEDAASLKILTSEAAEILAKEAGEGLSLSGLISLSPECARALSKHKGRLFLTGLDALSEEAAKELIDHIGDICFWEERVLYKVKKSTLSNFKSRIWIYNGRCTDREGYLNYGNFIKTISFEMAMAIAAREGWLDLSGLRSLSDSLSTIKRKLKNLFGYRSFNPVAEALSVHKGPLDLSGLSQITVEEAISLARHEGPLYLDGLRHLSLEAADALIDHKGYLSLQEFGNPWNPQIDNSAELTIEIKNLFAQIFAKRDNDLFIPHFRRAINELKQR